MEPDIAATQTSEMRLAARCLYNQRHRVTVNADRLRALCGAVGRENDLFLSQWCHLYALALEFQPDLIVELGRGYGNSTCVFTQAANDLPGCRVISFCLSDDWEKRIWPRVRRLVPDDWAARLEARTEDITRVDFQALTEGAQRILVFWDAHGIEIADAVLARFMPAIAGRPHVVAMHDVSDARHAAVPQGYKELAFWRGQHQAWEGETARLRIGWIDTAVDQVIPVLDFLARNGLELHSADHDVDMDIVQNEKVLRELEDTYPEGFFATVNHWVYFSLNEASTPYHFPAYGGVPDTGEAVARAEMTTEAVAQAEMTTEATAAPPPGAALFPPTKYTTLGRALCRDLAMYNLFGRPSPLTWLRVLAKTMLGRYRRHCR